MPANKQIATTIKKSLSKLDLKRIDERCKNEAQTRIILIEPFLEILGYSRIDDMTTELSAGWGKTTDKADIGLLVRGKLPEIIIECKTLGKKLTDKEAAQLNSYFINTKESKFGILTNGLEWRIYAPFEETKLHTIPFIVFNVTDIDDNTLETLSKLHKNNINLNELKDEAQEIYFLQGFTEALANELSDPSDDFIKAIFNRMNGKRITDHLKNKIRNLVNSNSIQNAIPKMIETEAKFGSILITTAEELKIYHSVKTLLLNNLKKIDASRISYRDQKNSFNILVDDNNLKIIAKIVTSKNKYYLDIKGNRFEVSNIESIVKLKKQLIEASQQFIQT